MTSTLKIEEEIKNILITIESLGYEAYIVGGAVRDKIIGKEINDYDICTNMPLDKIKELYPHFHLMKQNERRQVGVFNINGIQIEIAEFKGKSIREDISKRDFTINTILEDSSGKFYDFLGAREDIRSRKLRLVDQTGIIFKEDPIRIIRAIRLSSTLEFEIDQNCYDKMTLYLNNLQLSNSERIYNELKKMIKGNYFSKIFKKIKPFIIKLIPELSDKDYNKINELLQYTDNDFLLRIFIIFSELSKEEINCILDRFKIDNKTKKYLQAFISLKNKNLSLNPRKINTFINQYSVEFIKAFFTYQEIYYKYYLKNNQKLKELYEIEKKYYEALNKWFTKKIKKLNINPQIFTSNSSLKELVLIEDEVIRKITKKQLEPITLEVQRYLALRK